MATELIEIDYFLTGKIFKLAASIILWQHKIQSKISCKASFELIAKKYLEFSFTYF